MTWIVKPTHEDSHMQFTPSHKLSYATPPLLHQEETRSARGTRGYGDNQSVFGLPTVYLPQDFRYSSTFSAMETVPGSGPEFCSMPGWG
jgi:hypothetical protein